MDKFNFYFCNIFCIKTGFQIIYFFRRVETQRKRQGELMSQRTLKRAAPMMTLTVTLKLALTLTYR